MWVSQAKLNKLVKDESDKKVEELLPELEKRIYAGIESSRKVEWKDKCEFLFHHEGHDYFKYKTAENVHIKRFEQSSANLLLLSARLDHDELKRLAEIGKKSLEKAMNSVQQTNRIEGVSVALWVFEELELRRNTLMFHPDIMVELLALNIIRDDEDPKTIDEAIHAEKLLLFKSKGAEIPFFVEASLKEYLPNWKELVLSIANSWELHKKQVQVAKEAYENIYTELK
jgi:hypothetical protein